MTRCTKAPAFAKLPELVASYGKQLINMHELGNALDKREKQWTGQTLGQVTVLTLVLAVPSVQCIAEFVHN